MSGYGSLHSCNGLQTVVPETTGLPKNPWIENCVFEGNQADPTFNYEGIVTGSGGGAGGAAVAYWTGSSGRIIDSILTQNHAKYGGAIFIDVDGDGQSSLIELTDSVVSNCEVTRTTWRIPITTHCSVTGLSFWWCCQSLRWQNSNGAQSIS